MADWLRVVSGGFAAIVLWTGVLWTGLAAADEARAPYDRSFLAASAGAFNIFDGETTTAGQLEFRSDYRLWRLRPLLGVMGTDEGAVYGYAGVSLDLALAERFLMTASLAPGAYSRGDDRDLGHTIEFLARIELAYRFADESRLALALAHMSNAHLDEHNPGVETLMLTYALPLSRLFGP